MEKLIIPRVRGRCPAVSICKHLGNLRPECIDAKGRFFDMNSEKCCASMVMLLADLAKIELEPLPASPKIEGFSHQNQETVNKIKKG